MHLCALLMITQVKLTPLINHINYFIILKLAWVTKGKVDILYIFEMLMSCRVQIWWLLKQNGVKNTPCPPNKPKRKMKFFINCPRLAWIWCELDLIRKPKLSIFLKDITTMCGDCGGCGVYMKSPHFVVIWQGILCIPNYPRLGEQGK